jgi:transposase
VADTFAWYLGIDWGGEQHAFCLIDASGDIVGEREVAHTAAAIHEALRWVRERTGTALTDIAVGLERPDGALVDTLVEQGCHVFALNPKQLDRFRDRFTAGGAKDDRRDAHVVADALRTDPRAFRAVSPDDPAILRLRELCRILEDLQEEQGRLVNRLRQQLYRVNAPWLALSPAADEPWLWTVLDTTPHPDAWRGLARRRITPALREHRIRRLTVDEILTTVRQPTLHVAPGVADAVALQISAIIPQLVLVHQQRLTTQRSIDRALATLASAEAPDGELREHRDVEILQSLPGVGRFVAATMLTEAAGPLAARDYATLRAHAGTAPITKRSGKRSFFVHMRYACKGRLRAAAYHWSRVSIQCDQAARTYYDGLRKRGHSHARALRSVADRWLRILIAMLTSDSLYDPARFTAVAPEGA